MLQVGEIWRWTLNSSEHPDNPEHNVFLVLDCEWSTKVLYLASGRIVSYTSDTFVNHIKHLERLA